MKRFFFLFVILFLIVIPVFSAQVTVSWDANPEPEVTSYVVAWGRSATNLTSTVETPFTSVIISNLALGTNYFAVRAVSDLTSIEQGILFSDYTDPVPWLVRPGKPAHIRLSLQGAPSPSGPWQEVTNAMATLDLADTPMAFYRGAVALELDAALLKSKP